jgi:hypothetical protein
MQSEFVITGSLGSVAVEPGRTFVDNGVTWEVVGLAAGWSYSPSGLGGTPVVTCRILNGEPDSRFPPEHIKDRATNWCGDSLASAIIEYEAQRNG